MANSIDRFEGYAVAPGHASTQGVDTAVWAEFLSQFDGFFFLFCTMGLMYVVMSQYARHRRRQRNLEKMRAHWKQQNNLRTGAVGTNPKLRYDAGFWGDGQ